MHFTGKCLDLMLAIKKMLACPDQVLTEMRMAASTIAEGAADRIVRVMCLSLGDLLSEVRMAFSKRAVILDDNLINHLKHQGMLSGLGTVYWLGVKTGGAVHAQLLNVLPAAALSQVFLT
jgi:hypothetical protein